MGKRGNAKSKARQKIARFEGTHRKRGKTWLPASVKKPKENT